MKPVAAAPDAMMTKDRRASVPTRHQQKHQNDGRGHEQNETRRAYIENPLARLFIEPGFIFGFNDGIFADVLEIGNTGRNIRDYRIRSNIIVGNRNCGSGVFNYVRGIRPENLTTVAVQRRVHTHISSKLQMRNYSLKSEAI
ncbi:hypothetical protein [Paenirhodobacter populi]|uniref:hypothetical protein n=1 Tax=Paenirhodobacter populi TaxID=2306993 RepID=UPI0036D2D1B8